MKELPAAIRQWPERKPRDPPLFSPVNLEGPAEEFAGCRNRKAAVQERKRSSEGRDKRQLYRRHVDNRSLGVKFR